MYHALILQRLHTSSRGGKMNHRGFSVRSKLSFLCLTSFGLALNVESATVWADASQAFTEEALARGIMYVPVQTPADGQGVVFADLNNDNYVDIVVLGRGDGVIGVYENDGTGHFLNRSQNNGINPGFDTSGVVAGDYDNDGDLDLYISQAAGQMNMLLRNDGDFHFTDVTVHAGVADENLSTGCAWRDYDNDGYLDLYISNYFDANRLMHNNGDGTFEDMAANLNVDVLRYVYQSAFVDYDRDGDGDLYVSSDHGQFCDSLPVHNYLFRNDDGSFIDVTDISETNGCVRAMCIAIGDFDGNLFPDFYVTNIPEGNALMLNEGDGTFTRAEVEAGVASYAVGWGSVFFDYDNDGWQELYVCNMAAPNRLYQHTGTWPCEDISNLLGVDVGGNSYTVATGDIDNDGDLDLLLSNRDEPIRLFINHEGERRSWVKFDVIGKGASRYAIGANVELQAAGKSQYREIIAGDNLKSQNELLAHFGLADALIIDRVEVMWPGGDSRVLTDYPVNNRWEIYPAAKLGDADKDGDHDLDDFIYLLGCRTGDNPGSISPGCEVMDYEGDGDVDYSDFLLFLGDYEGPMYDCNQNGISDLREIFDDTSLDANGNGLLDECEMRGDINADGVINQSDLGILLASYDFCEGDLEYNPDADINGDSCVDQADLGILLAHYGT